MYTAASQHDGKGRELDEGARMASFQRLSAKHRRQRDDDSNYAADVQAHSFSLARNRAIAWLCNWHTLDSDTPRTAPISLKFSSCS